MLKLIVLILIIINCATAQNVETRTYQIITPTGITDRSIQFGASLIAIRSGIQTRITVGAPSYQLLPADQGRGYKGAVYTCTYNETQGTEEQCSTITDFEREGGIGISLDVAVGQNHYVVCGNTYSFNCPDQNQRWIGSCYKKSLQDDSSPELLSSPCASLCPGVIRADIIFVLDESTSVSNAQLNQERAWVTNVLQSFSDNIDDGNVNLGMFSFATSTVRRIPLAPTTFENFQRRLSFNRNLGSTYIAQSINVVTNHFIANGRNDVPRQMILLTDGQAIDGALIGTAARRARDNGITLLVVGVGLTSTVQLLQIAGSLDRVFTVSNFTLLDEVVVGLRAEITEVAAVSLEGTTSNQTNNYIQCGQGIASHINQENDVYIGAVGSYDRAGSVFDYISTTGDIGTTYTNNLNASQIEEIIDPEELTDIKDTYLGYSITSGNFYGGATEYIASGSPRYMSKGRVLIYQQESPTEEFTKIQPADDWWQLGSYFGHSVLAADLNRDSYADLLVSAPLFCDSVGYDQGRVFVYLNDPGNPAHWNSSTYEPQVLVGSNAVGSRFGMSISIAGDIDQNGFDDIIIGAPREELTDNSWGAIYLYYVDEDGISENRIQRIIGSSIAPSLKHFGFTVNSGNSMNLDVDFNGYPDIVVSAPSSDSVAVLRSRPIIDMNAEISFMGTSINVLKCLREPMVACLSFTTCIQAISRVELPEELLYGLNLTVALDVTSIENKRVQYFGTTETSQSSLIDVGSQMVCLDHELQLNRETFALFSLNSQHPLTVSFEFDFNQTHKSQNLSAILDLVAPNFVTNSISFDDNCNNSCEYDLSISAIYSIPQNSDPYVINKNPGLFSIDYTIRNNGPDHSFLTKVNITSGGLMLAQIRGNCVKLSETESSGTTLVLNYQSSIPNLQSVMDNNVTCNFGVSFSLEGLTTTASLDEIQIKSRIFSGSGTTADMNDLEMDNNYLEYSRRLLYSVILRPRGTSNPISLYYNRTTSTKIIQTLNDDTLGGSNTNILHSHMIYNQGPNLISEAPLTFTWPKSTKNSIPLLYLTQFNCIPENICNCSTENEINSFDFPKTGNDSFTINYPRNQSLKLPPVTVCSDVECGNINCQLNKFLPYQTVVVTASFKLWIPSLAQENLSTILSSTVSIDTTGLPVHPNNEIYKSVAQTEVGQYLPPIIVKPNKGLNLGVIIGAIVGGLLGLIILIAILWKTGFFKSKYAEKIKEAEEENDEVDQNNFDLAGSRAKITS